MAGERGTIVMTRITTTTITMPDLILMTRLSCGDEREERNNSDLMKKRVMMVEIEKKTTLPAELNSMMRAWYF